MKNGMKGYVVEGEIMPKKSSLYLKGRKCFKCESRDTRKNTFGSYLWYSHKDGHGNNTGNWICYSCKFEIGKQRKPREEKNRT